MLVFGLPFDRLRRFLPEKGPFSARKVPGRYITLMRTCIQLLLITLSVLMLPGETARAAYGPEASAAPFLQEARQLYQKHKWDASEDLYLKAAGSSRVEERILAYEGLVTLYRKVRLYKKAERAAGKLEEDRRFAARLVPEESRYYEIYEVRKGDAYSRLAGKRGISEEWLKAANGFRMLKVGERIRVPRVMDELVIRKKEKKLYWKRGDDLVKIYPVSIGRPGSETPEGVFKVVHRIQNPAWYWMKQVYPPGSPKNLLGTRWIGLDHKGYGIHGTRNPSSIGAAMSHGCIRMFNADVEELFPWIPLGARVEIRD